MKNALQMTIGVGRNCGLLKRTFRQTAFCQWRAILEVHRVFPERGH